MKRLIDICGAILGLVFLSPLLLAIAIAIRWQMGSPVLFRQLRPGRYGTAFTLVKFRTMRHALAADGSTLPDGDRLTRLGIFLRRSSLDELPELWNVLVGEMSLVGPRPLLVEYLPLYSTEQARRHHVRPGITGWAQINGRNAISWEQKLAHDIWYVDHHNLLLDLRIMALSLAAMIRPRGISQEGHATTEKFRGSAS